ncbi:hypothetical protein [Leptospira borgpetersenii]|uniref:hypothetical protein n=1 Tax=Leptospira borgpetersenii TaxID=174 RepID=UPI000774450A|nr:hypothetical protein [Leptospira borgpetersenii]MBE8399908.1 hypothetical protein [Leptospira borgpetersenii serovar Tarassovi]MBE8401978.1 hypothetical protein [Leptospira borgpetersenii serovar Tarassovi]MBE8406826.1 hypothetical protein [Leptospira borgpetersenii serovar Tarassovi]MBE8413106.1 hypothetical protein [Leptospira borgpetersenii serovar Tarassovi]MBE8415123.1 hypothetical protein [Leptospira borgpetersenii serovar Tarassovi]
MQKIEYTKIKPSRARFIRYTLASSLLDSDSDSDSLIDPSLYHYGFLAQNANLQKDVYYGFC